MSDLARLEPVTLRDHWPDESRDFTQWMVKEENLAVLSEALNMELIAEDRERPVGRYRADIVCRDAISDSDTTSRVLIENQLEPTNHTHLGQLITYAAGLDAVTVVWIAKSFTDEHRAALDWLNGATSLRFRFFGVELELWRIADSKAAPKFNVVSKPNDWTRMTRRIESGAVSELELMRSRFWAGLGEHMAKANCQITVRLPRDKYAIGFPIGRTGFRLQAWISMDKEHRIAVRLRIGDSDLFQLLKDQRNEIEEEVQHELEWNEKAGSQRCYVMLHHPDADPTDETTWPMQHGWMATMLQRFDDAFRPRMKNLEHID